MRLNLRRATILYAVRLAFATLTCAQTIIKLTTAGWGYLIVPVSINGSGPYPFLLDTGSNSTLVGNELLDTFGICPQKLTPAHVTAGVTYLRRTVAKNVTVTDLSGLEIEGIDADQISRLGVSVQAILGEDFLKHFSPEGDRFRLSRTSKIKRAGETPALFKCLIYHRAITDTA